MMKATEKIENSEQERVTGPGQEEKTIFDSCDKRFFCVFSLKCNKVIQPKNHPQRQYMLPGGDWLLVLFVAIVLRLSFGQGKPGKRILGHGFLHMAIRKMGVDLCGI